MLVPWKKSYDQPRQHIKKKRHDFANKGQSSQSCGFPIVMYGSESSTVKKAECRGIDAFELWCWRRLLRVFSRLQGDQNSQSWRKSVLTIHWQDWCWSWNSFTLATRFKEMTHWRGPWCWERLKAGGKEDGRGWDGWMASPTWWTWVWASSRSGWWIGTPGLLQSMGSQRVKRTELNWTELNWTEVNWTEGLNWTDSLLLCIVTLQWPVMLKKLKVNGSMKIYKTF